MASRGPGCTGGEEHSRRFTHDALIPILYTREYLICCKERVRESVTIEEEEGKQYLDKNEEG